MQGKSGGTGNSIFRFDELAAEFIGNQVDGRVHFNRLGPGPDVGSWNFNSDAGAKNVAVTVVLIFFEFDVNIDNFRPVMIEASELVLAILI